MRLLPTVFAVLLASSAAHSATVVVTVKGVRNDHGHVLVAVCKRADFLRPHCPWRGQAAAAPGQVVVRVEGVPPGTYAAQSFHDEDGNGRMERSILGLPKEAMGFSNDAPMHMGPPRFDAAAFPVGPKDTAISLTLHYF